MSQPIDMQPVEIATALEAAFHGPDCYRDMGKIIAGNLELVLTLLRQQERITAAAIHHDGHVWSVLPPGRHGDVIKRIAEVKPETLPVGGNSAQGFVTSHGRFVEREEGGRIALAAGQTKNLKWGPSLFSEDLW